VNEKKWVQKEYSNPGKIRIESRKEMKVVYVRHVGDYKSLERNYSKLMEQLFREAAKQNLLNPDDLNNTEVLAIYHDNPEFGQESQFRTSLCLVIPDGLCATETQNLGVMQIEGGMYASGHFEIQQEQFPDAWDFMYQEWLFTSDYVPRDLCPFEVYLNNPKEEPDRHIEVDINMPIEPM
jgi:AraC family transcriptional regulator